jgi:hypothetical protein
VLILTSSLVAWAVEVIPIASVLVSPSSFHRREVQLRGTVKHIATFSGREVGTNQPLCGYDFLLEDQTGAIEVLYRVRCQAGAEKAMTVTEGEEVIVDGSIDALPTNIRTFEGKDHGFRVLASRITRPNK